MAQLILDTGVLIGLERRTLAAARVVEPHDEVAIAAVTAAELWLGVGLADDKHRAARAGYVYSVLDRLRVEDYDLHVAREHSRLLAATRRAGRPRGNHDLIVAATAVARDRLLVTTDKGFAELPGVDVKVVG